MPAGIGRSASNKILNSKYQLYPKKIHSRFSKGKLLKKISLNQHNQSQNHHSD